MIGWFILTANGGITRQNGETGEIKSINYPDNYFYPSDYSHTWEIEGDDSTKRIGLIVRDFNTESCCDSVTVSRTPSIRNHSLHMSIRHGVTNNIEHLLQMFGSLIYHLVGSHVFIYQ